MNHRTFRTFIRCAFILAAALMALPAMAVVTQSLDDGSMEEFSKGTPKTTSVTSDGRVVIGRTLDKLTDIDADTAWDIAAGPDGRLYLATGHEGKIFAITTSGKAEVYCYMDEFEVYTLAFGPDGALYAGTSPGGKIYKITGRDEKTLYFDTEEESVWKVVIAADGTLYAATGPEGKIFKIEKREKGEVFYDAESTNITDLAIDAQGRIFATTHDKTYVMRFDAKGKPFVLHEAEQIEAREFALDKSGGVYVALNGERSPAEDFFQAAAAASAVAGALLDGGMGSNGSGGAAAAAQAAAQAAARAARGGPGGPNGKTGTEIIHITPDGFVDSFWDAPESPIHGLLYDPEDGAVYAIAGSDGHFFRIAPNGDHTLVLTTEQKYTTAFTRLDDSFYLASAKDTALFKVMAKAPDEGEFISRALDAKGTVRWGSLFIEATVPEKGEIEFATRSGNTSEPDDTWSEWTGWGRLREDRANVEAPVARYLQYKARLKAGRGGASPRLDAVKIYHAQPNRPPEIRDLNITRGPVRRARNVPQQVQIQNMQQMMGQQQSPGQLQGADSNSGRLVLRWRARDLNGDSLTYDLHLRGEGESVWIKLEENLDKPQHILDTSPIPDGQYRLKVVASDRLDNNPGDALEAEYISDRLVIDNTEPEIVDIRVEAADGGAVKIAVSVSDALSVVEEVEFRLNSEPEWRKIVPEDDLYDNRAEEFEFKLDELDEGDHILTVRATDAEGNTSVKKRIFSVKK